jgi:hypothetical protein
MDDMMRSMDEEDAIRKAAAKRAAKGAAKSAAKGAAKKGGKKKKKVRSSINEPRLCVCAARVQHCRWK